MTLIEIFELYWPQLLGVVGTVAPIMSVMVPKLLNDRKIIKKQEEVVAAVAKFESITGGVLKALDSLDNASNKLGESAVTPQVVIEALKPVILEAAAANEHVNSTLLKMEEIGNKLTFERDYIVKLVLAELKEVKHEKEKDTEII